MADFHCWGKAALQAEQRFVNSVDLDGFIRSGYRVYQLAFSLINLTITGDHTMLAVHFR
jgi:hypothetical protein